jgi:hypothetical protein
MHSYDHWKDAGHFGFGGPFYEFFLVAFLVCLDELVSALALMGLQKAGNACDSKDGTCWIVHTFIFRHEWSRAA